MHDKLQRESHKSDVCYRTHMTAFATKADEYLHLHHCDYRRHALSGLMTPLYVRQSYLRLNLSWRLCGTDPAVSKK